MPRLHFKPRPHGRTVRLVRHPYCPVRKRSRTVSVGSVRCDIDPEALPHGVRLLEGQTLDADDLNRLRDWLERHGDADAARQRMERLERIEKRIREQLAQELHGSDPRTVLARATEGLARATSALEALAREASLHGERPRDSLRPPYLRIYKAWERFANAAKRTGVAKQMRRRSTHSPSPVERVTPGSD